MAEENTAPQAAPQTGPKGFVPAILLCFFLGGLGAHRFYVGKIGTGILMILTLGGLGIWVIIDFVMIVIGSFTDKEGRALAR
jgi:TM2 domain-containing membrane protein YozV